MKYMFKFLILIQLCIVTCNLSAQQLLHKAVKDGKVDNVWRGINLPGEINGKNVIIGFTDWGFDYTHPVFYDTSMTEYRILAAWDQFRKQGPAPEGFNYGTEIVGKDALISALCDTFNVYGYNYHGNHVASIAAGAGAGTVYRGVANGAEMLFASFLVDEQSVIDAFNWMYEFAQKEQKRLVINMSWGLYYMGNLDGTGHLSEIMQELSDKGVVFVTSGGNNGDVNFHISHKFISSEDTLKTQFLFDNLENPNTYGQAISMCADKNSDFNFGITAMDKKFNSLSFSGYYSTKNGDMQIDTFLLIKDSLIDDTLPFSINIEKSNKYNQRPQVLLIIKTPPSDYTFGLFVNADSNTFHAWNVVELSNKVGNWGDEFKSPLQGWTAGDNLYGLGMPASVPCALTVAAHESTYKLGNSTRGGNIASFSSSGPCLNEETKPEISAPGYQVIAAISSYTDLFTETPSTSVNFNGRTYSFAPLSGTSMSSPFAAGVVALMLQANPYLTPVQIKEIIKETATRDYDTEYYGKNRFGFGKIDAYSAVKKAFEKTGTLEFKTDNSRYTVFPNPCKNKFFISYQHDGSPAYMEIYDISGRKLQTISLLQGINDISLNNYPKGCYILKIKDNSNCIFKKIIKG